MKYSALAFLVAVSSAALAQTNTTPGQDDVNGAFMELRQHPSLYVQLRGYDKLGTASVDLATDLSWDITNPGFSNQTAQLELSEYKNGALVTHTVGDGIELWNMDLTRNEYSTARYGAFSGQVLDNYMSNLVQSFAAVAKGQSIHVARLIREVYAGSGAQFRVWMPGAVETVIDQPGQTVQDPVATDRTYVASDLRMFVLYNYSKAPQRSLCFELDRTDIAKPWTLTMVFYADRSPFKTTQRYVNVSLQMFPDPATKGNYAFVPPRGARAVASPKPVNIQ